MSYHIKLKEYNCPSCNCLYIPYKENFPCPMCKEIPKDVPTEYFEFINSIIVNLKINIRKEGSYLPNAWYDKGGLLDYVTLFIFHMFDSLDKEKPDNEQLFINEYVDAIKFNDDVLYLNDYIKSVAFDVYLKKKEFKGKGIAKISNWWKRLLLKLIH